MSGRQGLPSPLPVPPQPIFPPKYSDNQGTFWLSKNSAKTDTSKVNWCWPNSKEKPAKAPHWPKHKGYIFSHLIYSDFRDGKLWIKHHLIIYAFKLTTANL